MATYAFQLHSRRREIDAAHTLSRQRSQGRPSPLWRRCNRESCEEQTCLYEAGAWWLEDAEPNAYRLSVKELHLDFVYALTSALWPEVTTDDARYVKAQPIAAFLHSPIVRCILWKVREHFKTNCPYVGVLHLKEGFVKVSETLRELMNTWQQEPNHIYHDYLIPSSVQTAKERSWLKYLTGLVMDMEYWRQYSLPFRPDWSFTGDNEVVLQIYFAMFLHVWELDQGDYFKSSSLSHEFDVTALWDRWFEEYPPLEAEEAVDRDHAGVFIPQSMNVEGRFKLRNAPIVKYMGGIGKQRSYWPKRKRSKGLETSRRTDRACRRARIVIDGRISEMLHAGIPSCSLAKLPLLCA